MTVVDDERHREILAILCDAGAFSDCSRCGTNGNGINFTDLLDQLLVAYPMASWTSQLLMNATTYGRKRGIYYLEGDLLYLNIGMVIVNQANERFQDTCPKIKRKVPKLTTAAFSHCGVFKPKESPIIPGGGSACENLSLLPAISCGSPFCGSGNRTH